MARARGVPAISTSAGSTSYAAKSTTAPLYVSSRTVMRFHGTATSRAYSANVRSHLPESGSGRAARAGPAPIANAMMLNATRRLARRLTLVEDRSGNVRVGGAEADRVLALLVLLERQRGVAHAHEDRRPAVLGLIAVVLGVDQVEVRDLRRRVETEVVRQLHPRQDIAQRAARRRGRRLTGGDDVRLEHLHVAGAHEELAAGVVVVLFARDEAHTQEQRGGETADHDGPCVRRVHGGVPRARAGGVRALLGVVRPIREQGIRGR